MDLSLDKIKSFLTSKWGKILMIIVALIIVYFIYKKFSEKRKYNGHTQKEVEEAIIKREGTTYLDYLKANDPAVAEQGLYAVAFWHDSNRDIRVQEVQVPMTLQELGISSEYLDVFQPMVGTKVVLTDYI